MLIISIILTNYVTGKGSYDLKPADMDDKMKADLRLIRMRNYLDPKRFYKAPDRMRTILHVGTVMEGLGEYKSSRIKKKDRRSSIVDEALCDRELRDYSKRKYMEIQEKKVNKIKIYKCIEKMRESEGTKVRKLY